MATTQDSAAMAAARQEIIRQLDGLSLPQLREVLALVGSLQGRPKGMSGKEFVELMPPLRAT